MAVGTQNTQIPPQNTPRANTLKRHKRPQTSAHRHTHTNHGQNIVQEQAPRLSASAARVKPIFFMKKNTAVH